MSDSSIEQNGEQGRRVLFMYKKLLSGYEVTAKEFYTLLREKFNIVSIRTIQRDLKLISGFEGCLHYEKRNRQVYWKIHKELRNNELNMRITSNELLSFHILKAHLSTFNGTEIEKDAQILIKKIEEAAYGNVFETESLYWNKNKGVLNYLNYDSIISRLIDFIINKKWAKIIYDSGNDEGIKKYTVMVRSIFQYGGKLYCVAYIPFFENHKALAVHYIEEIEERSNVRKPVPEFDFSEWSKGGSGVFVGNPCKVVLKINEHYKKYFEKHFWDQSQNFETDKNDDMILTINTVIDDDLISWIMSCGEAITVMKPKDLINKIKLRFGRSLDNYKQNN